MTRLVLKVRSFARKIPAMARIIEKRSMTGTVNAKVSQNLSNDQLILQ